MEAANHSKKNIFSKLLEIKFWETSFFVTYFIILMVERHPMTEFIRSKSLWGEKNIEIFSMTNYISFSLIGSFVFYLTPIIKSIFSYLILLIFDLEVKFKEVRDVICISYLMVLLGEMIKIPFVLLRKTPLVTFSLVELVPYDHLKSTNFAISKQLDFFVVGYLMISAYLIKSRLQKTKSAAVLSIFIPYLIIFLMNLMVI